MVLNLDEEKLARESSDSGINDAGGKKGSHRVISRLNFLKVGIVGGFAVFAYRLYDLQLNSAPEERKQAKTSLIRDVVTKAPRGLIFDRKGKALVSNQATYAVTITLAQLPDPSTAKPKSPERLRLEEQRQGIFDTLARFLNMPFSVGFVPQEIQKISDRNALLNTLEDYTGRSAREIDSIIKDVTDKKVDDQLVILKKDVPVTDFDKYKPLRELPGVYFMSEGERTVFVNYFRLAKYEPFVIWRMDYANTEDARRDANIIDEKRFDLPGVGIQTSYVRNYENPGLWAHILGYSGAFLNQEELDAYNKKANGGQPLTDNPDDPAYRQAAYEIDDRIGKAGVEYTMEEYLRGTKGGKSVRVNNAGDLLEVVPNSQRDAIPGHSVYLSIDSTLQDAAIKALEEQSRLAQASRGATKISSAAVVMDVRTGKVLAMVSLPGYNNNLFGRGKLSKEQSAELERYLTDPDKQQPLLNRTINEIYAPGSTFKVITALAGLNEGKIDTNTKFACGGRIFIQAKGADGVTIVRQPFRCWKAHDPQNVLTALATSCDVFFYNVGQADSKDQGTGQQLVYFYSKESTDARRFQGIGIDKLVEYMRLFGLGQRTGIELPLESKGILQTPANFPNDHPGFNWSVGETILTSIGQSDTRVTPLQLTNMTAMVANGGIRFRPRIVEKVVDATGKVIVPDEPVILGKITEGPLAVSPRHIRTVKEGMRLVTQPGGTAVYPEDGAEPFGKLAVAGKTGTAEYGEPLVIPGAKPTDDPKFAVYAWFTCFAPYDNPEIAVTTFIATDRPDTEGSRFAAPAAKAILAAYFPDKQIPVKKA